MTHAFFKAVLFLGAGSVIIALHHEQDMRKMGGLAKYMPITYATMLIGSLANAGIPPFAGFFSKDSIVEALAASHVPGHTVAYVLALAGVFVSALYSFRLLFYAFHGAERFQSGHGEHGGHGEPDEGVYRGEIVEGHGAERKTHGAEEPHHEPMHGKPHESPWVVTVPLVLLAIPSIFIGAMTIGPMLYGGWFEGAIAPTETMEEMAREFHGWWPMVVHSFTSLPLWLALAGIAITWWLYIVKPGSAAAVKAKAGFLATILENKYYLDDFNDWFFAGGMRRLGSGLWLWGDKTLIDGIMVNGTARLIGWFAAVARRMQTGFIYHYAFTMIFGVFALLSFFWVYLRKL
jgi:NADH-quinone oxidoreductase subunit L